MTAEETTRTDSPPDDDAPLVSVVLPTYDRPEKLGTAVESVAAQTYPNVELIVVDDASPTPAKPVLDSVAPDSLTYTYHRHDENRGANAARNTGIRAASGDIVSFIDDDDYWDPRKTAVEVSRFDADPRVGVVLHSQRLVHEGTLTMIRRPETHGDPTVDLLTGKAGAMFSAISVRRSVIETTGLPDEELPSWQDREWLIRLSTETRFAVETEPLVTRRSGNYDQIEDGFEAKRDVSYPRLLERHRPLAARLGREDEFVASLSNTLANTALRNGFKRDARRFALKSIRHDPTEPSAYLCLLLGFTGDRLFRFLVGCRRATAQVGDRLRRLVP
jgi:glycosyltransferase involved in cell wall biosynthesis